MILAQLVLIANLTFSNGATVTMARLPYSSVMNAPVVVISFQRLPYPPLVTFLNKAEAMGWAYEAWQAQGADTVSARWGKTVVGAEVKVTMTCGMLSDTASIRQCTSSLVDVKLFGSTFAYLRPGPLPKSELRTVARLLWLMAGWQPDSLVSTPYRWVQP